MSRQSIVGLFTILGLVSLFVVYFVLSDFLTRASGYEIGVHFDTAAGLTRGSLVYESGVQVGNVARIKLLDDFSVELVLAIKKDVDIPKDSKFVISSPLTGSSTLAIVPPEERKDRVALLPRKILPLDQQPRGTNPVSVSDLLAAGQGELAKLDALLTDLQKRAPKLLATLESTLANANELAIRANGLVQKFSKSGDEIVAKLQHTLDVASTNIDDLTGELNDTLKRNSGRVDTLMVSLNKTAVSLNDATSQMQRLISNPETQKNLTDTLRQFSLASANIQELTANLKSMTGDPTTQAQFKNTIANVDALTQRLNSLLGAFGGTSSVYGVDAGATPPPASSGRIVPASAPPAVPAPQGTAPTRTGEFKLSPALRDRINQTVRSLVEVQIRISGLSAQPANVPNTALLNQGTGPQGDFNVVLAPQNDTRLFTGVNDLSANQTWNFALEQKFGRSVVLGGGILYSRLGLLGQYNDGPFGLEARAYGMPGAYLDGYLHLRPMRNVDLFGGERDILHNTRRTVYGVQLDFLGGK
ncbi:MAG: MCE family protein [Candidatus Eremiobacteraeota bacterium]|nr:MCE family protein [Candidatus Eremiobacteraeota bacterium]